jgi:hypothetical protein
MSEEIKTGIPMMQVGDVFSSRLMLMMHFGLASPFFPAGTNRGFWLDERGKCRIKTKQERDEQLFIQAMRTL